MRAASRGGQSVGELLVGPCGRWRDAPHLCVRAAAPPPSTRQGARLATVGERKGGAPSPSLGQWKWCIRKRSTPLGVYIFLPCSLYMTVKKPWTAFQGPQGRVWCATGENKSTVEETRYYGVAFLFASFLCHVFERGLVCCRRLS